MKDYLIEAYQWLHAADIIAKFTVIAPIATVLGLVWAIYVYIWPRSGGAKGSDVAAEDRSVAIGGDQTGTSVSGSSIILQGEGGKAPGAGGGGGGAIGSGAQGGRGGDGGSHRVDRGEFTLPFSEDAALPQPWEQLADGDELEKSNPGAGGGGAAAIGDGARGGDGGGGGEIVSAIVDIAELEKAGLEKVNVTVGKGGPGSSVPGQHGKNGEDTVLEFISADGTVLKRVQASGGQGGKSGSSCLPNGTIELSSDEISEGFRITSLMTVNSAETREGLAFILGGDWKKFPVQSLPLEVVWPVFCSASWNAFKDTKPRAIFLSLRSPNGLEVSSQNLIIPTDVVAKGQCHWCCGIAAPLDAEGEWTLQVHSGGSLLGELDIRVYVQI